MSTMDRPLAFVVLGMHRSGTSAVAGALVRRGANAGRALLPSTSDNANGYFEDARLVAASDALLAAAGLAWDEPGPLPRPLADAAAMARLVEVFTELRASKSPAVVKDPRACRLVPEWSQAMAAADLQPAYLIVLRDPREVAASLQARDGLSAYRAGQLWLEHLLDAEHATRGAARVFLRFDELMQRPDGALDEALAALGAGGLNASAGTGIEPGMRRQRAPAEAGGGFADAVYGFAKALAGTAASDPAMAAAFDAYRAQWRAEAQLAREALDDALQRQRRQRDVGLRVAREVRNGLALVDAWDPPPSRTLAPRVYWRALDAAYSEDRSRAVPLGNDACGSVQIGDGTTAVARLRIDPDDRAGVYEIAGLRVDGQPLVDLAAAVVASSGVVRPTADGLVLVAVDDDPWIEIALDAPPDQMTTLAVAFQLRTRGLPDLLWSLVQQDAFGASRLRELEARLEGLAMAQAAAHAQADGDMDALHAAIERLEGRSREVLAWARRRTLRYWWRRWRGMPEVPGGAP